MNGRRMGGRAVFGAIFFTGLVFLFGLIVKLLWNALIPPLFSGPLLNYWQAVGLLILTHILLRGHAHGFHAYKWRHHGWRHDFERKLADLPPEEREKIRMSWASCCGYRCEPPPDRAAPDAK